MIYHRKSAKKNNNANLYKHMVTLGIYRFKIILIRTTPCNNREELLREERIEYDKCDKRILLNQLRPIVTTEEKHIESIEQKKKYYEINKDVMLEKNKLYYKNNEQYQKEKFKNTNNTTN